MEYIFALQRARRANCQFCRARSTLYLSVLEAILTSKLSHLFYVTRKNSSTHWKFYFS